MHVVQVDLRHIDEARGTNVVELGVDLSEFYTSVEWDILEVPAVRYSHCNKIPSTLLQLNERKTCMQRQLCNTLTTNCQIIGKIRILGSMLEERDLNASAKSPLPRGGDAARRPAPASGAASTYILSMDAARRHRFVSLTHSILFILL